GAAAFQLGLEDGRIVLRPRIDLSQCTGELPGVELVPSRVDFRFRFGIEPVEDAFGGLLLTQHLPVDDANGVHTLPAEVSAGETALFVAEVGQSVVVVGAERGLSVSDQIENTHIPLLLRQNQRQRSPTCSVTVTTPPRRSAVDRLSGVPSLSGWGSAIWPGRAPRSVWAGARSERWGIDFEVVVPVHLVAGVPGIPGIGGSRADPPAGLGFPGGAARDRD